MKIYLQILINFICINLSVAQTTVGLTLNDSNSYDDGYVLFAPIGSTNTYLIDKCGKQVKTWPSDYKPGQSCYLLPDGTLLRAGNVNNTTFTAGGKGGIIEKIDWNGNVIWSYNISSATECQHHDIKALPNGNVLAIVWELKTNTEAINIGRNPALTTTTIWTEKIIEIQPNGANGGTIVWEWHIWNHLIQDFDNTKPNYGTVSSNPGLIDLNFSASANTTIGQDWIHLNSIDYNPSLDQILVSSHSFDEIWIIDHSTSTSQAASNSGGNSGKGGDLLYRWGNPQAYDNGTVANQKFFGQHNAHWIATGLPNQNQIMIFNNGNGRTGGNYSTVEIINPPVNGYNYYVTLPFLPASTSWIYNANNTGSFYAQNISGAEQLANGNVLYCDGPSGIFTEVDTIGTKVWQYVNPVNGTGIINQGATPNANLAFRASFYQSDYAGFSNHKLVPSSTIENSNTNSSNCTLSLSAISEEISSVKLFPNPVTSVLNLISDANTNFNSEFYLINNLGEKFDLQKINTSEKSISFNISSIQKGIYFFVIRTNQSTFVEKIIIE